MQLPTDYDRCQNCGTTEDVISCQNCSLSICKKCSSPCEVCKIRFCIWCEDDICEIRECFKYVQYKNGCTNFTHAKPKNGSYQIIRCRYRVCKFH